MSFLCSGTFSPIVEYQLEMKISVLLAAAVTAKENASWQQKEWEVQDAVFAGKEVVLSDPLVRSNKTWQDCGDKPHVPVEGHPGLFMLNVKCDGAYCAAVCVGGIQLFNITFLMTKALLHMYRP